MIKIKIYPVFWFALVFGLLIGGLIAFSGNRPTDGGFIRQDTPTAALRSAAPVGEPPERDIDIVTKTPEAFPTPPTAIQTCQFPPPTPTPIVTMIYPTTGVSWTNTPVPPSATPIVIVIQPTFGTSVPQMP